jgi:hypothetical protein
MTYTRIALARPVDGMDEQMKELVLYTYLDTL